MNGLSAQELDLSVLNDVPPEHMAALQPHGNQFTPGGGADVPTVLHIDPHGAQMYGGLVAVRADTRRNLADIGGVGAFCDHGDRHPASVPPAVLSAPGFTREGR